MKLNVFLLIKQKVIFPLAIEVINKMLMPGYIAQL